MANSQMSNLTRQLRRAVLLKDGAGLTDGQLLGCFIEHQEEAAFAALLRRHGPMVWGVCRRILRSYQDVEDAFQATFLVLLRKAHSIRPREMVANWLYGVAHQTALNARAAAARRKAMEKQVTNMPEPAVPEKGLWHDLQPLLDQELSRLPHQYRILIVLCDLEGKTRKKVAQQLGCPEGTVAGRLVRARAMLARRIARHGLVVSGTTLATALTGKVMAVPVSLIASTSKAVTLIAAGHAATGLISVNAAALAKGVLKTMLVTKLKIATVILMVVSTISFGGGRLAQQLVVAQEGQKKAPVQGEQTQIEIIKLKHVRAADAARILDELINGTKLKNTNQAADRIRVEADDTRNSLIIKRASALDRLLIRRLLGTIDKGVPPPQNSGVDAQLQEKDRKLDAILERLDNIEKLLNEKAKK